MNPNLDDARRQLAEAREAEEKAHLQTIVERDEATEAFDQLCAMIDVETEYSNMRGFEEILEDCQVAVDNGVGKTWHADNYLPLQAELAAAHAQLAALVKALDEALELVPMSRASRIRRQALAAPTPALEQWRRERELRDTAVELAEELDAWTNADTPAEVTLDVIDDALQAYRAQRTATLEAS